jgi:hypothetical protein
MSGAMTLDRESVRCLRILAEQSANLPWPCRNATIPWLVGVGYARKVREYQARWNNKMHDCAEIIITDKGRQALQANAGSVR